ncbi:ATP-binding protein [Streptomyces yaizuensis]|uniref:ATP-binding protein n=1 Tax=Streptomyces yaizuensis TaxID=2989713 RepID=A0ABQ5P961_9ACTN|nr:ATP-binding protein [Streptomyces sp. YSPA8]GLF99124.1 ATP-binding protein [Streptomyces sp. YSPA8]
MTSFTTGSIRSPVHVPPTADDFCEVAMARQGHPGDPLPDADRRWPGRVRRITRARLRYWKADGLVERAELIVSELVTNAFAHGRGPVVRLWLSRMETYVRIEVGDGGTVDLPERPTGEAYAENENESGRGLELVAACADAWGAGRASVWCALRIPERQP